MTNVQPSVRRALVVAAAVALIAGAMTLSQPSRADAASLARGPAAVFLQFEDEVAPPQLAGGWYARYDGIDGEATDEAHPNWINIDSIYWEVKRADNESTQSRRRAAPVVSDFEIGFQYEKAAPKLVESALLGRVFPKVEVELTIEFGVARSTYLRYEMKNVIVSSYNVGGNADGTTPDVVVANNWEEIKIIYTVYGDDGQPQGNVETSWKKEKGI